MQPVQPAQTATGEAEHGNGNGDSPHAAADPAPDGLSDNASDKHDPWEPEPTDAEDPRDYEDELAEAFDKFHW